MTSKRACVLVSAILIQLATAASGCASQSDPSSSGAKTPGLIPASEASQSELGVTSWKVTFTEGGYSITGHDEADETRFAFRTEIGKDGGIFELAGSKSAVLEFTTVDGQIRTGRNDFIEHSDALHAANLAMGDLNAALATAATASSTPRSLPFLSARSGIHTSGGSLVGGDAPLTASKSCNDVVLVADNGSAASCGAILNERSNLSAGLYQCQADNRCVLSTEKNNMCVPCNDLWNRYQRLDQVKNIPACNQCAWTDPNG